jgi:NADH-quinone oxidoreductase subunit A
MQPTLTPLAAVVLLFLAVGVGFIFFHLLAGKFIRPNRPAAEKKTIYECGEPTIGSAWIQFDLRFYVVALLFVIFDVEVAFFFPWAEVFGKAQTLATASKPASGDEAGWAEYRQKRDQLVPPAREREVRREQDAALSAVPDNLTEAERGEREKFQNVLFRDNQSKARQLVWMSLGDIAVFFGVLLVGFAYLWRRGDLEWVRSTLAERPTAAPVAAATTNGAPPAGVPAGGTLVEAGS